jgi:hypothetical protein
MVLILLVGSGIAVIYGKATPYLVGLLLGVSGMLCQLFFVLVVVFLVYSDHATSRGHGQFDHFNLLYLSLI